VISESWFRLSSWSSRIIRTDSPAETSTRFLATRNSFISGLSVIVISDVDNLNQQRFSDNAVNYSPLKPLMDRLGFIDVATLERERLILEDCHRGAHPFEAELAIESLFARNCVQNDLLVATRQGYELGDDLSA
jgi:hypothetical protein